MNSAPNSVYSRVAAAHKLSHGRPNGGLDRGRCTVPGADLWSSRGRLRSSRLDADTSLTLRLLALTPLHNAFVRRRGRAPPPPHATTPGPDELRARLGAWASHETRGRGATFPSAPGSATCPRSRAGAAGQPGAGAGRPPSPLGSRLHAAAPASRGPTRFRCRASAPRA